MNTDGVLIVGYTTKPREDADQLMPDFEAPSNYGPEKSVEYVRKEREKWQAGEAARLPYTGEFNHVCLMLLPTTQQLPGGTASIKTLHVAKLGVKSLVAAIMSQYGDMFDPTTGNYRNGELRIVGSEVRTFAKILGLSAAEQGVPLPHAMWYQSDYRDIESAVCPEKQTTLKQAFARLLPDTQWMPFGISPRQDVYVTARLCYCLNLFPKFNPSLQEGIRLLESGEPEDKPERPKQTQPLLVKPGLLVKPSKRK